MVVVVVVKLVVCTSQLLRLHVGKGMGLVRAPPDAPDISVSKKRLVLVLTRLWAGSVLKKIHPEEHLRNECGFSMRGFSKNANFKSKAERHKYLCGFRESHNLVNGPSVSAVVLCIRQLV